MRELPSLGESGVSAGHAKAARLLAEAERADKANRQNTDVDNARPDQLRDEAATGHDSAEPQASLTADRNQASPPSAALSKPLGKAPAARKNSATAGVTKQAQKGLTR